MGKDAVSRIDLHLHSRASGRADNWWVKGLGTEVDARESYTPPEDAYRMAKRAGMDFVTLTDHETVEGALTLTHHPDFITGEEVSAVFPEDGSFVDVLVYGPRGEEHRELQARRPNVYELVDYLRETGLAHVLAHPMYGMPGPLNREQVEKRLVLFGVWEFVNGSRPAEQNRLAQEIAARTGILDLRQMAARHGLLPPPHRSIAGTGGSDDHGGVYGGSTHTVVPRVGSVGELLEALASGLTRPSGEDGTAGKLVHTGFKIASGALEEGDDQPARALESLALRLAPVRRLHRVFKASRRGFMEQVPLLARLDEPRIREELAGRYEERLAEAFGGVKSGFPAVDFFGSIGDVIDGHLLISPYVAMHGYFGRESKRARTLRREVFPGESEDLKAGLFVDGIDGVHGVGTMYRSLHGLSREFHSHRLELVRCGAGEVEEGAHSLRPIATLPVPLYDGLELGIPSLLDVMEHIAGQGYDVLHVAAPGPLGLAALVSGLVLGIPVVGAYHTEFGAYARALSGDDIVAESVEVAVRQFYERCSAVAVPSQATALALRNRGYRINRFEILKNGVDTNLFAPEHGDSGLRESLGGGRTLLLYAGRVSREKDLERLAEGYLELRSRRDDAQLVVAGDGPYRENLRAMLGETATFTGFLSQPELARVYASCDVFVFPSTTDTLGRAVAEAQASGLPAVVCGTGGPRECIRPGVSGFVAEPGDGRDFFARVESLLEDPESRRSMGRAAREFAETLSWESVLEGMAGLHARAAGSEYDPARVRYSGLQKN